MMTTYSTCPIHLESPQYDTDILPAELKNTHRILPKYLHARYECDVDLTMTLYVKQLYTDVEISVSYTLSKSNTYAKIKLPLGLLCRGFRYQITGVAVSVCTIYESGLLWTPKNIGGK